MIPYLGSKRKLLPQILAKVPGEAQTALDLFSGTSRVGHALKEKGLSVTANDHNAYAMTLARCYVEADREDVLADVTRLVTELNALPERPGYFTETFCEKSRYFQPKNGARIDAIREAIQAKSLPPALEAVMLVSLMEAASRVDSTLGLQMAYLKEWAPRAHRDLELRAPDVLPRAKAGPGKALGLDALEAAQVAADLVYLDPPYNQHKYLGNYHVWESLVRWDKPEVYGVACKRVDCKTRKSLFNSKASCLSAFQVVVRDLKCRWILASYSSDGFIQEHEMHEVLATRGEVSLDEVEHPRYVGSKTGGHNPQGVRIGVPGKSRVTERIFFVEVG